MATPILDQIDALCRKMGWEHQTGKLAGEINITELSRHSGIATSTISEWGLTKDERPGKDPEIKLPNLKNLADAFGVTLDTLVVRKPELQRDERVKSCLLHAKSYLDQIEELLQYKKEV